MLTGDASDGAVSEGARRRDPQAALSDFPTHDTLLFQHEYRNSAMLEHRILDEGLKEVGHVAEGAKSPGRKLWPLAGKPAFCRLQVAIYDGKNAKVLDLVRPAGFLRPVRVADAAGRAVGAIVKVSWKGRFALEDAWGQRIGTISQAHFFQGGQDWTVADSAGTEVGWIADSRQHAARLERERSLVALGARRSWRELIPRDYNRHFLAVTGDIAPDLRLLMLGAAAGLYLALDLPPEW